MLYYVLYLNLYVLAADLLLVEGSIDLFDQYQGYNSLKIQKWGGGSSKTIKLTPIDSNMKTSHEP